MQRQPLFGLLNIDKPAGLTSRRVVDRVQMLVKPAKVGHAGTLDPLATGVLIVCIGPATRLISYAQQQSKEYTAGFVLGKRSNTDDMTGDVEEVSDISSPSPAAVESALQEFVGRIEQVPPQFSAVHVGGQRAYKLARSGRPVTIEPRVVEVHRISLVEYDYPHLRLDIECGSGTYIRSIGRDLGEKLGCGAVMGELARTRVGPFRLDDAVALDNLDADSLREKLLPADHAVAHLPHCRCSPGDLVDMGHGRLFPPRGELSFANGETVAVLSPAGELACLARYDAQTEKLSPRTVFLQRD